MNKKILGIVLILALVSLACSASSLTRLANDVVAEVENSGDGSSILDQVSGLLPQGEGSEAVVQGEVLLYEDFSSDNAWEYYVDDGAALQVSNGAYNMYLEAEGYIWGVNEENHSDVSLDVTATQLSSNDNNGFGLVCRADTSNNGDGYYFLISGDGFFSIVLSATDSATPLVDWTSSSAINQGMATNRIKAVCVDNYLALYINDTFAGEAYDSTFSSGYAGMAVAIFEEGTVEIAYDDLTISAVSLGE